MTPDPTCSRPGPLSTVWHEDYEIDLGEHVYPTEKYRLVRDRLASEEASGRLAFHRPGAASREDLLRVHDEAYLEDVAGAGLSPEEEMRLEVPFTPELRRAMLLACGGTLLAARRALGEGVAVHLGGGFHHAFADHGEGFCLLNDAAVAIRTLLDEGRIDRAAVVDLDVHQGNGTARIFRDEPRVFTLSLHQERLYPARKPPSDLDVGLPDRTGDDAYLERLDAALPRALEEPAPDLALYLAGADPYRRDQLGGLSLSREGLRRRDRAVLSALVERRIPGAVLLAGGYAVAVEETVSVHEATVREALRVRSSGSRGDGRTGSARDERAGPGEVARRGE